MHKKSIWLAASVLLSGLLLFFSGLLAFIFLVVSKPLFWLIIALLAVTLVGVAALIAEGRWYTWRWLSYRKSPMHRIKSDPDDEEKEDATDQAKPAEGQATSTTVDIAPSVDRSPSAIRQRPSSHSDVDIARLEAIDDDISAVRNMERRNGTIMHGQITEVMRIRDRMREMQETELALRMRREAETSRLYRHPYLNTISNSVGALDYFPATPLIPFSALHLAVSFTSVPVWSEKTYAGGSSRRSKIYIGPRFRTGERCSGLHQAFLLHSQVQDRVRVQAALSTDARRLGHKQRPRGTHRCPVRRRRRFPGLRISRRVRCPASFHFPPVRLSPCRKHFGPRRSKGAPAVAVISPPSKSMGTSSPCIRQPSTAAKCQDRIPTRHRHAGPECEWSRPASSVKRSRQKHDAKLISRVRAPTRPWRTV